MNVIKKKLAAVFAILLTSTFFASCSGTPLAENDKTNASALTEIKSGAKISYLGPEGTYTEEAALFFFSDGEFQAKKTVQMAIDDVISKNADYAVIPQENTLGGAVTNYIDALIASKDIYVVGEVILPINQTLMGIPGTSLDEIKTVCSHAQGIKQSEKWRKDNLPDASVQEMDSTAAAASFVAEKKDKSIAAIAAPRAAELYGLSVLKDNVQITDTNKTRFYVLSDSCLKQEGQTNAVFVASCEANRLDDIIIEMHNAGVELVTIHDRPEGSYLGNYNYILEVTKEGALSEDMVKKLSSFPEVLYRGNFSVVEK